MKEVKVQYLTGKEKAELKRESDGAWSRYQASKDESRKPINTTEELIEQVNNQTITVLREVKNAMEWKDVEKMVKYALIMKKLDENTAPTILLEDAEVSTVIETMTAVVTAGKIQGYGLEKFVAIYSDFKDAPTASVEVKK